MAKRGAFIERFPYAGLFFVIAVAIAIPITVWSLRNAPTQTTQQASACSGAPYVVLYDCKNFESSATCGNAVVCARHNNVTGKWTISSSNLGNYYGFNDKASSIKLVNFPYAYQVRFYESENFGGVYITTSVSSSVEKIPDLSSYWRTKWFDGFNNQITSLKSL